MRRSTTIVPTERIERAILLIRGERVMLDADLAAIYGVTTKRLNQQVKRNADRFPPDFMFQLSPAEKSKVVTNCDHLAQLKYSPHRPFAFTEHGALMLANVLNSARAARTSVVIVRTFIRLRRFLASHSNLWRKLAGLERRYDAQFKVVFQAIRDLMAPAPAPKRREIGFHVRYDGPPS